MVMTRCKKIVGESSRSDTIKAKKDPDNKKWFYTKLSLVKVVALNKLLTKEQKIAVESIGFGSILTLQCDTMRQSLCAWIVRNFDVSSTSMVIHGKKLKIDCDDVEQILGLPNQGSSVPTDGPIDELMEELCRTFSVKELIPLDILSYKLEECKTHGDEFKRMYCIYILGYLLCPSGVNGVKKVMLHVVKDVNKINTFNWAQFVLDYLANGIKQSITLNLNSVRGCLFVLMIFFLEHVNPGKNLLPEHNMNPSISYWSNDKVADKLGKFKTQGGYESPSACFVLDKRVVHKAGESADLECVETQVGLSKIESHISELKNDMQDVQKKFCEVKDMLRIIVDSERAKRSDNEETGDQCGPTVRLTGNGGERVLDDDQNVSNQSLIGSSKKLRIDGEFTEMSKKEEMLLNEVKKLESEINELRERNREEFKKRDEKIVRLESELCGKEHLIQCYREAFEELEKDFDEESICEKMELIGQAREEGEE